MITLTLATVEGDSGWTLAQLDSVTLRAARWLGGPASTPEVAAGYLREVYTDVIRTAGAVTLAVSTVDGLPVQVAA